MTLHVGGSSSITLHRAPKVEHRVKEVVVVEEVPVERVPLAATLIIYLEGLVIALLLAFGSPL